MLLLFSLLVSVAWAQTSPKDDSKAPASDYQGRVVGRIDFDPPDQPIPRAQLDKLIPIHPGDRLKLIGKRVFINGKPLDEPYVIHQPDSLPYRDNFPVGQPEYVQDPEMAQRANAMLQDDVVNGELVIPAGFYFAMGDNRDNSLDSRYWGLVPRDNIVGKPLLVYWSYDASTEDLTDYNLHHLFDLATHFFTKTRWNRTLKLIHGYPLG